jgi:pyruvate dehydrogenase E2 component (dihydrolipoamide acetyltransferase)
MVQSKTTIPHFYLTTEIDMTAAVALRTQINAWAGTPGVSFTDLIVKACALALQKFPAINATYHDGQVIRFKTVNIGIAVATPDALLVVVVRDAHTKPLQQIARESRDLIERARAGKATAHDLEGATFTISNLGMFEIDEFIAIIPPGQSAILAVGAIQPKPVVVDDQVVVRQRMRVTLSGDHRVFYGAEGAQFLQELRRLLENPISLVY